LRGSSDPEPAAFVAEEISPPTGTGGTTLGIMSVGNRPGTGDDYDAGLFACSGHQCDQRIVDHNRPRLLADSAHDVPDGLRVSRPIDPSDTQADGVQLDVAVTECLVHHSMQDLLDTELTHHLQIGARRTRLGKDLAAIVREQAHRLRSPCIDAEYVHRSAQV